MPSTDFADYADFLAKRKCRFEVNLRNLRNLQMILLLLSRTLLPLPQSARHFSRQPMSQLPRQHAKLTTMMCLVSNEVTEKVHDISREVLPVGWWHITATRYAEPDQFNDATTALCESTR
jgi:hypothetical protein